MNQSYNNPNPVTQGVSLCIPRISGETGKCIIAKRFSELGIGNVCKIDMITKTSEKGEKFYSAFIHIEWNDSELSKYVIERVTSGKDIKIIYDGFLFWKVLLNKSNAYKNNRPYNNQKSRIDSSRNWERNTKIL